MDERRIFLLVEMVILLFLMGRYKNSRKLSEKNWKTMVFFVVIFAWKVAILVDFLVKFGFACIFKGIFSDFPTIIPSVFTPENSPPLVGHMLPYRQENNLFVHLTHRRSDFNW